MWSVCLSLTLTQHGTKARFSPRSSQCPSAKSPHWEDSALVTGGVNRRGVVTVTCQCARFNHRLVQERWDWWSDGCLFLVIIVD